MATLITLPHEIQSRIAHFLRPPHSNPFEKSPEIARFKGVHSNLKKVLLWNNLEWKGRIREWRDKNLTKMRWKYRYGTLPDKMIELGWENKINNDYRHQDCYVQAMYGTTIGTGFVEVTKEYKVIWFEVSLLDLVTGVRSLPHCFGSDGSNHYRAAGGNYQLTMPGQSTILVPAPSLETLIPVDKRREWLEECFMECVLLHWVGKIVEKNGAASRNSAFMKGFKKIMHLPVDYKFSQTDLFKMFLRELNVGAHLVHEKQGYFKRSQNIDQLCQKPINLLC